MHAYTITIANETFTLRTDAEESQVRALEKELQSRYATALGHTKGPRSSAPMRAMTMVALQTLAELSECRAHQAEQTQRALHLLADLRRQVDELLDWTP